MYTDAGVTRVASDGDLIYQIDNKGTRGDAAIQATLAKRPEYKTNLYNGNSAGRWDGIDDALQAANVSVDGYFTWYVVGKFTTGSGYMLVEHSANWTVTNGMAFYGSSGSPIGVERADVGRGIAGVANWMGAALASVSTSFDGATNNDLEYFKDGVAQTKGSVSPAGDPADSTYTDTLNIGARNAASVFSNGDFCEVIGFSQRHDAETRQLVWDYLKEKWGTP